MIDWLAANWVNILVIALVAVMVFFAARSLIKDKKAGKSS
ncbi:MAG: FeoB-associated Cys-rich membrane protein, partial [Clostridiales bacterium]|nr:FeoB-associated Cys-rich membrane protein [Clostridiales bacterium]